MNQYCAAPSERRFVRLCLRKRFCNPRAKRKSMLTQNAVKFKDKFTRPPTDSEAQGCFWLAGGMPSDGGLKMNSAVRALWMQNVRSTVLESSARSRIKNTRLELSYNFK